MKKLLLIICLIFILNQAYADDSGQWVDIKAANNKTAQIDMSRLSITNKDIFTFFSRSEIDGVYYVYKIIANLKKMSMKYVYIEKYSTKTGKYLSSTGVYKPEKEISPGSLNEAMILYLDSKTKDDVRRADWNEWLPYHNDVVRRIKKAWKPKYTQKKYQYMACKIKIDKQGNIIGYEFPVTYENTYDEDFIYSIKDTLANIRLKTLPNTYKEKELVIKLAFIYKYTSYDKSHRITVDDEGYHKLNILKK